MSSLGHDKTRKHGVAGSCLINFCDKRRLAPVRKLVNTMNELQSRSHSGATRLCRRRVHQLESLRVEVGGELGSIGCLP